MTRTRTVLAAAMLLACLPASAGAAPTYPAGFEERTVASNLTGPTTAAWAPDGRLFVAEKAGKLKVVPAGGGAASTILDLSGQVNSYWDRGLLGLALDSNFASNRYVYLLYTREVAPMTPDGSGAMVSRLTRITVNPDNSVQNPAAPETILLGSYASGTCPAPSNTLDCIPSEGASHSIGTVRSAPDGTLWVGSGDASSFGAVDPLALGTYDERSFRGKILHVDRAGRGLARHPFCPTNANLDNTCTKLHAKGFRNPFRFTLRPGGGLAVGDVGWNTREEVDLIGEGGGNSYGWPCYEGTIRTPGYRDRSECATEYAKEGTSSAHLGPAHDYVHEGSSSVLAGPEYSGDQYPNGYRGTLFFGDYSKGFVRRLEIDAQNRVTAVRDFALGWTGTALEAAPNGDLVYVSFGTGAAGTGSVKRIVYSPGNASPVAVASATPDFGQPPLRVQFDASGSSDRDGDALTYQWDFGDGTTGTGVRPAHTYTAAGSYTARLTVSDGRGLTGSETVTIVVGNEPPTPTIEAPVAGSLFRAGQTVNLRGSATDPEDGPLPSSALSWHVVLIHIDHVHVVGDFTGAQASFLARDDHDADSYYEVTLTARDSRGQTASRTREVRPQTTDVSVTSSPPGAPITWAGSGATAPLQTRAAVGFRTTVSAADSFVRQGRLLRFDSWSDGGPRAHDITVPATPVAVEARYRDVGAAGIVASLSFDEGTGTRAADASGTGNDGALQGAAWTAAGRYGRALSFDGVDDRVTVPDADSLDLTTDMTLEAWVKPRGEKPWQNVMMKESTDWMSYALYATSDTNRPSGWTDGSEAYGSSPLPARRWSHLAATFSSGVLRLYVDGVQVATATGRAAIGASAGPLRIGANDIWAEEAFQGLIDEVRVYDRALSPAEIATDRATSISGAGADTAPPAVTVTAPGAEARVAGSVALQAAAADDQGVEEVEFRLDGTRLGQIDTTAPYSAAWDTTGAGDGSHVITATAIDSGGNSTTSAPVRVTVKNTPDPPPPAPGPPTAPGPPAAPSPAPSSPTPTEPPASGDRKPAPDRTRPSIRARRPVAGRHRALSGTVLDASGVARVDVALAQPRQGACRWFALRSGFASRALRCDRPRWMRATLTRRRGGVAWKLSLRRRLAAGPLRLVVRARDRAGNSGILTMRVTSAPQVRKPR